MKTARNDRISAEVCSKQQIIEQLYRWGRGCDRVDLAIMASVFHPGANINYGYSNCAVEQFLPPVLEYHRNELVSTSHIILNPLVKLNGDEASSEAIVDCRLRYKKGDAAFEELRVMGRYLDRWKRLDEEWQITDRISVVDRFENVPIYMTAEAQARIREVTAGQRTPADLSYQYV